MVKIIRQNNQSYQSYYQCEECGFKYREEEWAKKCETWCKKHKSCNLEITQYAIGGLSKKERKFQKRIQKEIERKRSLLKRKFKRVILALAAVVIIGGGISSLGWYFASKPLIPESEIISRNGIHWHPEIKILIFGKEQEVPAGIGLGITERPIHTHEADRVIHLEFPGVVRADDIRLGRFFEIFGKKFNKDCILDKCSGPEGRLKMLVNGKENSEFENYIMRDGDKIEIIFE